MPPPSTIKSGSYIVECDEPLDLDPRTITECNPAQLSHRPYKYKRRKSNIEAERGQEVRIRYVVVRNVATGEEEFRREYRDKECEIDIYWEPPNPTTSAA